MKLPANAFRVRLIKKESITADIVAFSFSKPDDFNFLAGQYLRLTLPHEKNDDRGTNRFFTISSAPSEDKIMIITRKGKSSFKQVLFALQIGAEVTCFGPLGTFVLEEA